MWLAWSSMELRSAVSTRNIFPLFVPAISSTPSAAKDSDVMAACANSSVASLMTSHTTSSPTMPLIFPSPEPRKMTLSCPGTSDAIPPLQTGMEERKILFGREKTQRSPAVVPATRNSSLRMYPQV